MGLNWIQVLPFQKYPGEQVIFWQPLLIHVVPVGHTGVGEQVEALIRVPGGHWQSPFVRTKGDLQVLTQSVPFQAVLVGH